MIVEDGECRTTSMAQVFKDPRLRERFLKIVIQTLYNMGFEESAAQLEAQANITYYSKEVKEVKQAIRNKQYYKIGGILQVTGRYHIVKPVVEELICLQLIREGKTIQALQHIQTRIQDPNKQAQLSEELMMGTGELTQQILQSKHNFIIEKCMNTDIYPNSMAKMIASYIQLQKKGLTTALCPGFQFLKSPPKSRKPPMKVLRKHKSSQISNVSFIKFNRNQSKILVVSSLKKQKILSVWSLNRQKQQLQQLKHCTFNLSQQIVNVSWSFCSNQNNQIVALCTHSQLFIFNMSIGKLLHKKKIIIDPHQTNRILCLNWNCFTELLYVGGSFESIRVFGESLDEVITIQPFLRTRIINFNKEGTLMYAVSATKNLFILYDLFEQKQHSQFHTEDIITSFRLQNNDKNILLVTQKKIILLQVSQETPYKFSTIFTTSNPYSQNGLVQIEACMFYNWIVCLGQNQFQAVTFEKDVGEQQRWNSRKSFTYDLVEGWMVSGQKQLYLWSSGDAEKQNFQEQKEDSKKVIMSVEINPRGQSGMQIQIQEQEEQQDNYDDDIQDDNDNDDEDDYDEMEAEEQDDAQDI